MRQWPDLPDERMTVAQFLAWADARPDDRRFELDAGRVVPRTPETIEHVRAKAACWSALIRAARHRPDLHVIGAGVGVAPDDATCFLPDVTVLPERPDDEARLMRSPLVVVEVASPGVRPLDTGAKLIAYARLPSLLHILVVAPAWRCAVHHRRVAPRRFDTAVLAAGETVSLNPPGLAVAVEELLGQD